MIGHKRGNRRYKCLFLVAFAGGFSVVFFATGDVVAQTEPTKEAGQTKLTRKDAGEAARVEGDQLILTGLALTLPAGWKNQPVTTPGPMAPKAVFEIPNGDKNAGIVRITHYPEMKGKDDANIDRWLAQVTQADGKPSKRDQAKIESFEVGTAKVTLVDLSGDVKITMRDESHPGYRMIAAIVNHPKGPHFVVAAGPADLMEKSKEQVVGFLKSAKVN